MAIDYPGGIYALAHAAGWDAGHSSARKAGRNHWNADDYQAACDRFHEVYSENAKQNAKTASGSGPRFGRSARTDRADAKPNASRRIEK